MQDRKRKDSFNGSIQLICLRTTKNQQPLRRPFLRGKSLLSTRSRNQRVGSLLATLTRGSFLGILICHQPSQTPRIGLVLSEPLDKVCRSSKRDVCPKRSNPIAGQLSWIRPSTKRTTTLA